MSLTERIAELYFRPRAFELGGALYEWLGVRAFQRLMVAIGRRHVDHTGRPSSYLLTSRAPRALRAFERRTRSNEITHLMGMLGPAMALVLARPGPILAVVLVFLGLLNCYPFILQRYNRIRLRRVLDRFRTRRGTAA